MENLIVDYSRPTDSATTQLMMLGIWLGRASLVFAAMVVPASYLLWILGFPLLLLVFATSIMGTIFSRGKSICGWIGITIIVAFACLIAWNVAME